MAGTIWQTTWEHFLLRDEQLLEYELSSRPGRTFQLPLHGDQRATTNAEDLSRMGWEEISTLERTHHQPGQGQVASPAKPESAQNLNGAMESLLSIDDPGVLLETWKPAEDGDGTILRFLDFGGTQRTVSVRIPWMHLDTFGRRMPWNAARRPYQ